MYWFQILQMMVVRMLYLTNSTTTQARIKIEPVNNIFYAVNSANFSIDKTAKCN